VLRGFPIEQVNLTIRREFPLYDRARLQFRAEKFKALNHPSFVDPSGAMQRTQFGYSTQIFSPNLGRGGVNAGFSLRQWRRRIVMEPCSVQQPPIRGW
jgi:hypothetical protein